MRFAAATLAVLLLARPALAQDAAPSDTVAAEWSTNVDAMEGDPSGRFVAACPPGGSTEQSLSGTGTYTTDSSICLAAVHAGALTLDEGGAVVVEVAPGLDEYVGTTQNGVTSKSWTRWHSSIRFPDAPEVTSTEPREVHQFDGDWYTRANSITAPRGAIVRFECSAGGTGGNVWGTDIYTDDSSICEGAVHAGEITRAEGGAVHFELLGAQESFAGTERNDVTTMRYPGWPGSFRFVEIEGEPAEADAAE